jgi:signal transduction histidine kinase
MARPREPKVGKLRALVKGFPAVSTVAAGATVPAMRVSWKEAVAGIAAIVALGAGAFASTNPYVDPGVHLAYSHGQLEIVAVDYGSAAQRDGVLTGTVVETLNGEQILSAPDWRKEAIAADPPPIQSLTVINRDDIGTVLAGLSATPPVCDQYGTCSDGAGYFYGYGALYGYGASYWYPDPRLRSADIWPVVLGLAILLGGWWFLRAGGAGESLRRFALTLPVATAMPLLLIPVDRTPAFAGAALASVLVVAGMLPLAFDFAATLPARRSRIAVRLVVAALGALAVGAGLLVPVGYSGSTYFAIPTPASWRFSLLVLLVFVPGLLAARPSLEWRPWPGRRQRAGGRAQDASLPRPGRFVDSTEIALAGMTPGVAAFSLIGFDYQTWPIILWLAGVLAARRFGLQPLTRLAQRASYQRDLVVSATERERARIAADIHDYALQDLTMLVRRLDASGDADNAAAARDVADRLRAICGDLRLPILDDLGVGPALDWLVDRLEPNSERLDLELFDRERRLTPEAELVFFRVAQEAITNALHHGAEPIMVRYWGGGDWAELIVDDTGPGIPPGAAEAAERTGHMGLMNMTQRAESIGAELTFGRRPGGGARVHMVWEGTAGQEPARAAEEPPAAATVEPA